MGDVKEQTLRSDFEAVCAQAHQMQSRIEQAKTDFADLMAQSVWLAERLSEARILVNNDSCARCTRMSFEACKACWLFESARAVREGRHSK